MARALGDALGKVAAAAGAGAAAAAAAREAVWVLELRAAGPVVVTASDDKTVKLWRVSTGACLRTLEGHSGHVNSVCLVSADAPAP